MSRIRIVVLTAILAVVTLIGAVTLAPASVAATGKTIGPSTVGNPHCGGTTVHVSVHIARQSYDNAMQATVTATGYQPTRHVYAQPWKGFNPISQAGTPAGPATRLTPGKSVTVTFDKNVSTMKFVVGKNIKDDSTPFCQLFVAGPN